MSPRAYYNEFDPKTAAWLRELIRRGLIAAGDVDERSICDVQPDDLKGYTQCHFFAGIGGWSYALRLAGWSDDRPVWTGSCPCQPFSAAGKGLGTADHRHLWPQFFRLIAECRPSIVFGEQVASKAGRKWLNGVRLDLEGMGYGVGAADLCAAGVGSPHIRQRLYWLAHAGFQRERAESINGMENGARHETAINATNCGEGNGHWSDYRIIHCGDGKARRLGRGITPLAHGVPARVVRIRGYGNAIVPQLAAEFIKASEEALTAAQAVTAE